MRLGILGLEGCSLALSLALVLGPVALLRAQSTGASVTRSAATAAVVEDALPDPVEMARVDAAVDRALAFLAQKQQPDGSWPCSFGKNNAINALGLLAFLGKGHVPGRGPYKAVVDRAVAAILATQEKNGLYRSPNPSSGPMYEHALATLAMIEAYGFLPTPAMKRSVQSAVNLIIQSQSPLGGWRYQPVPGDADLSVTVMQIVALRAALNARLEVPEKTIQGALVYVRACSVASGGFSYQPKGSPTVAQSAAGTLCMQLLGAFDDPSVAKGADYLNKLTYNNNIPHFWYTNYYAMQAMFQIGGNAWAQWHPKVREYLLKHQQDDGSFPGFNESGVNGPSPCYSTAFASICLEVYMHCLPAYQR